MNLALVSRMAWRDVRSGEMGLLLVALLVAVGTVTSISLFVDRLQGALVQESSNFLAADRQVSSSRPIPDDFFLRAEALGLETSQTLVFQSMIYGGDNNQLVSVKAVDASYPLRGELIVADQPFADGYPVNQVPLPGDIWLDSRLFPALGVSLGFLPASRAPSVCHPGRALPSVESHKARMSGGAFMSGAWPRRLARGAAGRSSGQPRVW